MQSRKSAKVCRHLARSNSLSAKRLTSQERSSVERLDVVLSVLQGRDCVTCIHKRRKEKQGKEIRAESLRENLESALELTICSTNACSELQVEVEVLS